MTKYAKIHFSSHRNITFQNEGSEDYILLPDWWDEMTEEDQQDLLRQEEESYLWELVEVYATVVDESEVPEHDR